jgi:pimeloyl-ACP methyl ester carboxylesterase
MCAMPHPHRLSLVHYALLAASMTLTGCVANPHRYAEQLDRRADAAGLIRDVVQGTSFSHIFYRRATVLQSNDLAPDDLPPDASPTDNAVTLVYLEGDGMPSRDGLRAAIDPTPKHALAFELMAQTKQRAWYVTRPCYNSMLREPHCDAALWTHARYSTTVVDSMAAALTRHSQAQGNPRLVLVGYSGGGVLAVLMASRVPNVVGVITVAANLDTEG